MTKTECAHSYEPIRITLAQCQSNLFPASVTEILFDVSVNR